MTATNHVLTGVIIASTLHNPLLALPLAFLSHFALDALPHFGMPGLKFNSFKFKLIIGTDFYMASLCLLLVLLLRPPHTLLILLGGVIAASPDLMWLPEFTAALKKRPKPSYGPFRKFHTWVQWYQKPSGTWVEVLWFVTAFTLAFAYTL